MPDDAGGDKNAQLISIGVMPPICAAESLVGLTGAQR